MAISQILNSHDCLAQQCQLVSRQADEPGAEYTRLIDPILIQQYGWGTKGGIMRHCTLALLLFGLVQAGCTHEIWSFQPAPYRPEAIQHYERLKRELLQLEDLKVGDGAVAASGRKVTAEITVRYSDGTLAYEGPVVTYWGMIGDTFINNSIRERGLLSTQQEGIMLGLNGMAVGGKRRIVVPPNMVCYDGRAVGQSLDKGEDPRSTCMLVHSGAKGKDGTEVRKLPLILEATLTAACRPVFLHLGLFGLGQGCRDADLPIQAPGDPIWRFYHVVPDKP